MTIQQFNTFELKIKFIFHQLAREATTKYLIGIINLGIMKTKNIKMIITLGMQGISISKTIRRFEKYKTFKSHKWTLENI